jgi:hypothetical protein
VIFRITTNRIRPDHEVPLNKYLPRRFVAPLFMVTLVWNVESRDRHRVYSTPSSKLDASSKLTEFSRRRRVFLQVYSTPSSLFDADPVFNALSWVPIPRVPENDAMLHCHDDDGRHNSSLLPCHFEHPLPDCECCQEEMLDERIVGSRQLSLESHNYALHHQLFYLAELEALLKTHATNKKRNQPANLHPAMFRSNLHLHKHVFYAIKQQAIFIRCVWRLGVSKL